MTSDSRKVDSADNPLVSVVVPAYNVAQYIGATLESLRVQTFPDMEILVVDDASTDDTVAIVKRWDDPRVRLLRHEVNLGVAEARNTALNHARGRFIAHLDPDDVAFPERIERQVFALQQDTTLGMIGAADAVMNEAGASENWILWHPADSTEANVSMFFENSFSTSALMMRAESIVGQRYLPIRVCEDYEFNARIARSWKVGNLEEPLVWRRRRGGGLTSTMRAEMLVQNRRIIRQHLRQLGLEPTERQVELSLHIGKRHLELSLDLVGEIEAWLETLCRANQACRKFGIDQFDRIMSRKWFDVCSASVALGPVLIPMYANSRLSVASRPSAAEWSRFAVKSIVQRWRRQQSTPTLR